MKRTRVVLFGVLAVAVLVVVWLARSNRLPPPLPSDAAHAEAGNAERCLSCHGPEGSRPRPRSHPPGKDCARCHAASTGR